MHGSARSRALASVRRGSLIVQPATEEPALYDHLLELLSCVREYVEHQARSGATGFPRDTTGASHAEGASATTTEPPASLPRAPTEFESGSPVEPIKQPDRADRPTVDEAAMALTQDERVARLKVLKEQVAVCTRCRLHAARTQTVFARGTFMSGICFVGEGPGADEDAQGLPFVGKAGQLLDRMIVAMGLVRDDVYICNIVKCRPPENRKPQPDEAEACRAYLEQQLSLTDPEVIVALGATAVEGLLGVSEGITRMRGKWKLYRGRIPVMPTFHPAYLLRNPSAKHAVWDDMCEVLRHLGRPIPPRTKS